MIIKIGLIYSKDIGVGVLNSYIPVHWRYSETYSVKDKIIGHAYANEVYMYIAQNTPLLTKGRTCAVYIYTL